MSIIVEVVHFSLDSSCTEQDLLGANEQMKKFLSKQAGLIYRSLAKKEDGSYVDVMYWQDMDAALAGQKAYYDSDVCKMVGQLTDIDSVTIEHAKIISTFESDAKT